MRHERALLAAFGKKDASRGSFPTARERGRGEGEMIMKGDQDASTPRGWRIIYKLPISEKPVSSQPLSDVLPDASPEGLGPIGAPGTHRPLSDRPDDCRSYYLRYGSGENI